MAGRALSGTFRCALLAVVSIAVFFAAFSHVETAMGTAAFVSGLAQNSFGSPSASRYAVGVQRCAKRNGDVADEVADEEQVPVSFWENPVKAYQQSEIARFFRESPNAMLIIPFAVYLLVNWPAIATGGLASDDTENLNVCREVPILQQKLYPDEKKDSRTLDGYTSLMRQV